MEKEQQFVSAVRALDISFWLVSTAGLRQEREGQPAPREAHR